MKKFLFLLLGLAVASSAMAGSLKKMHPQNRGKAMPRIEQREMMKKAPKMKSIDLLTKQSAMFKAPVTEQPEGEVKRYNRAGQYDYVSSSGGLNCGDQTGKVEIVFAEGNQVYLKNILCGANLYFGYDTWVSGTYDPSTNTITVPMEQAIGYDDYWEVDIILCWGTTYIDDEGYFDIDIDPNVTEAVYLIDGETIYLQGTNGPTELDPYEDASYLAYGLGACYEDDHMWYGFLEWNTVLTYTEEEDFVPTLITEQPEGTLYTYKRSGEYIYSYYNSLYTGTQSGDLNVVFDNNGKAYIQDPLYSVGNGNWVVGDYDYMTGIITVPTGQFLTWYESSQYGVQLMWGHTNYTYNEEEESYYIVPQLDETVTEIQFMIDDDVIYLMNSSGNINAEFPEWAITTGLYAMWSDDHTWAGDIEFNTLGQIFTLQPAVPANPTADQWYDCGDESGFSRFYFTLPHSDVNGRPIDPEYLSYSIFVDNGNGAELFTFPAEDYTFDLSYDITEVPYWLYSDAVDFHNYYVYMYRTNEEGYEPLFTENIGIQVYYTVDGVRNASEIVWLYEAPEPEWALGDVNHDTFVNVADVTALIQYILTSGELPEEFYLEQANVDGDEDGQINVSDVTALIQLVLNN